MNEFLLYTKVSTENVFFGIFGFSKFSVFRFSSKTEKTENPKMRYTVHLFRLLKSWPCMCPKWCIPYQVALSQVLLIESPLIVNPMQSCTPRRGQFTHRQDTAFVLDSNFLFKFPLTSYCSQINTLMISTCSINLL